tara:strand:+ start:113 stop:340 length:228 start_codon:yes stop_codon:yes gene_type:complete
MDTLFLVILSLKIRYKSLGPDKVNIETINKSNGKDLGIFSKRMDKNNEAKIIKHEAIRLLTIEEISSNDAYLQIP